MNLFRPLLVTLALTAGAAQAQGYRPEAPQAGYREGLPAVNAPRPAENPDAGNAAAAQAFRRWYAQAGRPSILVFWNRELTDETATQYADVTASGAQVRSSAWGLGTRREGAVTTASGATVSGRVATTGGKYAGLDAQLSSQLEAAFQGAFLQNGARLIDRTALIRKTSAKAGRADRDDLQFMETLALQQGVAYLVEVLPAPQGSSPTGFNFTVNVKHLPSSRVVAQFNTQAAPPLGPEKLVAAPGGFERRRENRTSLETIGAELAYQTMTRLR